MRHTGNRIEGSNPFPLRQYVRRARERLRECRRDERFLNVAAVVGIPCASAGLRTGTADDAD
jgi:hypothetical protein